MAKIAFILLCHKDPKAIIAQAERLTAAGDVMAIHFDRNASAAAFLEICNALKDNPNVAIVKKREKCGWGEWSLVQATINAVQTAVDAFPRATHFYMLSGDCMAIKTAEYAHRALDAEDVDYIENNDYFESDWIKTGFKEERLIYRHFFNERTNKALFYASFNLQKRFGISREIPKDLSIKIGSQWWCLRRQTVEAVLEFVKSRKDIVRFFRTTWIPDETFFQTVVCHLIPKDELRNRTLTFLMFSDYGMPLTFYDDHFDLLLSQDYLFARKISPRAKDLRRRLGKLYATEGLGFTVSNEGRDLFKFMTGRGRNGNRFARRFWERGAKLDRDQTLLIVTCKKWHVAKRMVAKINEISSRQEQDAEASPSLPALEYVFNELEAGLPHIGGIESTLEKRTRNRRAFIRLVFEALHTKRMLFCLDPSDFDVIRDFYGDSKRVRTLEIDCEFTDDYLLGHAKRVKLAGEMTPQKTIDQLIPTIRHDIQQESNRIHDQEWPNFFVIKQDNTKQQNARALADFLQVPMDTAREIASTHHLFSD